MPAAVAILAATFVDDRARTKAFGIFSAAAASGFTAGLVLGGVITSGLSWRWIFLAKVPAVALTLLAAVRAVPQPPRRRAGRYDLIGGVTITAAAVLLTLGVTRAGSPTRPFPASACRSPSHSSCSARSSRSSGGRANPAATIGGVHAIAADDRGVAAGLNNSALQIGGAIGLALVGTAVSIGLGGAAPGDAGVDAAQRAVWLGGLATTVLPLVGATVVAIGLSGRARPERVTCGTTRPRQR